MDNKYFLSERISAIYNALGDDESRELFVSRMTISFSEDIIAEKAFIDMMESALRYDIDREPAISINRNGLLTVADFLSMQVSREAPIVLFGAGMHLRRALLLLRRFNANVVACADNDELKWGKTIEGIDIISPQELFVNGKYADAFVGIANWFSAGEIIQKLVEMGLSRERIFIFLSREQQYFGFEMLKPVPDEIYVDTGCFNTETIKNFIGFCDSKYCRIYGIEADSVCYSNIKSELSSENIENLVLVNKGAWDEETILRFNSNQIGSISTVSDSGNTEIHAATIDSIVNGDKVTLIKMDIEGAELEALYGAENTIKSAMPRLAISIYHKPGDIIDILAYINSLVPEYKFYIRQYSYFWGETILYAII